jgi:hypothetical protein
LDWNSAEPRVGQLKLEAKPSENADKFQEDHSKAEIVLGHLRLNNDPFAR